MGTRSEVLEYTGNVTALEDIRRANSLA